MERHNAFDDLNQLYKPLLNCLESIKSNSDPNNRFDSNNRFDPNNRFDSKSTIEAAGPSKQLQSSSFIISFHTCHFLFGFTKELSKQLQGSIIEITKAYEMVSLVTEQLDSIRLNQFTEFKAIFRKCELMANFSDVSIAVPRTVQPQTMRSNGEHNSPEEYFRKSILSISGWLVTRITRSFPGTIKRLLQGYSFGTKQPSRLSCRSVNTINSFYQDDMPHPTNFDPEIQLPKCYWSTEKTKVDAITSSLKHLSEKKMSQMFPNITRILVIYLTTVLTGTTVERANSSLRYIKMDFRNSVTEDRFNAL